MNNIPKFHDFFNPTLKALKALGGSGSIKEINDKIIELMGLSAPILEQLHDPESRNETEVEYRLAWARTYLKKYGLINNSSRGVWALTERAEDVPEVVPGDIIEEVRNRSRKLDGSPPEPKADEASLAVTDEGVDQGWEAELHRILTKQLEPAAFERLIQRVLRESGFVEVNVTGRSGDGGIDGKGIAKIHGLMSFHVVFQCKRYQGVVSAGEVRDFRGAMVGRSDKGIFITTGTFSRDAVKEATRDGAPPIDLIDGDQLAAKLKELRLGVKVERVERVTVDPNWFQTI